MIELLQVDPLPNNIYTVGGMLALFAGVIAMLFQKYTTAQENRFAEMKDANDRRAQQLQKDLDEEKSARRLLQQKVDDTMTGQIQKSITILEKVEDILAQVSKKL